MVECLYCKSWMSVAKTLLKKKSVWMLLYKFSEISQNTDMCCFALFGTIWAILKTLKTPMEECYFEEALVRLLLSWRLSLTRFSEKKLQSQCCRVNFLKFLKTSFFSKTQISVALHDLGPFVQFKKCEKHSWRSVTFRKVTGFSLQLY